MRLDPDIIRREIDALLVACPELADDESLRHDTIEGSTEAFALLEMLVRRAGECRSFSDGLEDYIEQLHQRLERINNRQDGLRKLMFRLMDHANLRKAELTSATLSIRNGSPKVIITDEAALPMDCLRVKHEPDRAIIKNLLNAGQEVPGATLSNGEPSLAIRVK